MQGDYYTGKHLIPSPVHAQHPVQRNHGLVGNPHNWDHRKGVFNTGFFKKNSHPIKFKTIHVIFPPSPNSMLYSELCVWRPSKKQPFLFIVFGTSKHNFEVGGYGGNVCIYGVSCGWLFFLKNPVIGGWDYNGVKKEPMKKR